jgi:hypothetical protein
VQQSLPTRYKCVWQVGWGLIGELRGLAKGEGPWVWEAEGRTG